MEYEWPGNIRELRNVCEQLAVLVESDTIEKEDVLRVIALYPRPDTEVAGKTSAANSSVTVPPDAAAIQQALLSAGGNKRKAAEILGISRTTLWRKLLND